MAQEIIGRPRTESPERWAKALQRAITSGLEVFTVADTGERFVTSASRLDVLHRTDGITCTCEAALSGDPCCQHRAAARFCLGWLQVEEAPTGPTCPDCCGCGQQDFGRYALPCDACAGTGRRPDHRLRDVPAVEIVSAAA